MEMANDRVATVLFAVCCIFMIAHGTIEYEQSSFDGNGNKSCSRPVDCDCNYIKENLHTFCNDERHWGEMSGCHVDKTHLNYSVSWCPKFIRNKTCVPEMKLRLNFFDITDLKDKIYDQGDVDILAYIPGFNKTIFNKTINHEKCSIVLEELGKYFGTVPGLSCPLSLKTVIDNPSFRFLLGKNLSVPNPIPTIVPAGSYHLLMNVTTTNPVKDFFLCVDGWLEFGV